MSDPTHTAPRTRRRRRAATVAALLATSLLGSAVAGISTAAAAVPAFPDNIVVFPDRDFVSVEGYEDHAGELGTIEVRRSGVLIGKSQAVVEAGGVAFEINHPGGACWGVGAPANLQVTPDIKPGDVVSLSLAGGGPAGETTVGDSSVTQDMVLAPDGVTLTVTGFMAAGMNRDFFEQRIIAPDLRTTAVGKRDIRALPGPLTPAARGGYSSGVTFNGNTFVATYVFDDPAVAAVAAAADLGERAMTWQEQDADGNRQGLTIAEYGEAGGPGMGGCPPGPAASGPPVGAAAFVRSADRTSMAVTWTQPAAIPTAAPITGYDVTLVNGSSSGTGSAKATLGARTGPTATSATVTGLDASAQYSVEVRSMADSALGAPFPIGNGGTTTTNDTTAPTLTAAPPGGATEATAASASSVTLTSSEPADVFYTLDGTPAIATDVPSETARLYTGPIPVTAPVEIHWAAFDAAGNHDSGAGFFKPPVATAPTGTPGSLGATGGQLKATLRWAYAGTDATSYDVRILNGTTQVGAVLTTANKSIDATLAAGTYTFTVTARNAQGTGPVSAASAPFTVTAAQDTITIASAVFKSRDLRVRGTTSAAVGSTVSLRTGSATGTVIATATVTAPAVAGANNDFDLRNRTLTANPGTVWVTTTNGAKSSTVTNG